MGKPEGHYSLFRVPFQIDADGDCTRCGLKIEPDEETMELHECPPGFMQPSMSGSKGQAHIPDASNMAYAETVESVTTWANETFGQATVYAQIQRAKQELDELLELMVVEDGRTDNGKKLAEEAADVCICLYRVIGTLDPEAINKKMAINRARKWKVDGHGCAQHVKEPS